MAAEPATVDPLDLYALLGFMAAGRSYVDVHGNSGAEQLAKELEWVRSTRRAVMAAARRLFGSQQEARGDTRLGLALLAAAVPDAGFAPTLRRFFREAAQPEVRQVFATALAVVGERDPQYMGDLAQVIKDVRLGEWLSDDAQEQLHHLIRDEATDERDLVAYWQIS